MFPIELLETSLEIGTARSRSEGSLSLISYQLSLLTTIDFLCWKVGWSLHAKSDTDVSFIALARWVHCIPPKSKFRLAHSIWFHAWVIGVAVFELSHAFHLWRMSFYEPPGRAIPYYRWMRIPCLFRCVHGREVSLIRIIVYRDRSCHLFSITTEFVFNITFLNLLEGLSDQCFILDSLSDDGGTFWAKNLIYFTPRCKLMWMCMYVCFNQLLVSRTVVVALCQEWIYVYATGLRHLVWDRADPFFMKDEFWSIWLLLDHGGSHSLYSNKLCKIGSQLIITSFLLVKLVKSSNLCPFMRDDLALHSPCFWYEHMFIGGLVAPSPTIYLNLLCRSIDRLFHLKSKVVVLTRLPWSYSYNDACWLKFKACGLLAVRVSNTCPDSRFVFGST